MAAMSTLVSETSLMIVAPLVLWKPTITKRSNFRSKKSVYTPPISSFNPNAASVSRHLPSMHVLQLQPISALIKEKSGVVGNTNRTNCFGSNGVLFWNDLDHNEIKLKCNSRKTDVVVADDEDEKQSKGPISESNKYWTWLYATVIGASFCIILGLCSRKLPRLIRPSHYMEVPYTDLVHGIKNGSVIRVQFVENSRRIYFNTKSLPDEIIQTSQTNSLAAQLFGADKISLPKWHYHTRNVEDEKYELYRMLNDKGITFDSKKTILSPSMKNFLFVFFQVTPFWIMVLLTFYQLSVQHDLGKLTKKKPSKKQSVTFDDVKGADDAKTELLEIVMCMKGDNKYVKLGAKLPRGVLLTGPPGTGKTLLARAVAGEAGVPFFSISASELVEVFVGRGAARVRKLFSEARKNSSAIIFIDEIDAVGGQRGKTLNCERDQTLNQLLTEMDGFEKEASVVVIAATNRPEMLDSALMRPGRFSRKVRVGKPNENGRKEIVGLYLKDYPMEDNKEEISQLVASLTPGLVGADLENIVRESVLLAGRRGGDLVTRDDVLEAVDRAKGYDHVEAKPFPFGSTTSSGSMSFGSSN